MKISPILITTIILLLPLSASASFELPRMCFSCQQDCNRAYPGINPANIKVTDLSNNTCRCNVGTSTQRTVPCTGNI